MNNCRLCQSSSLTLLFSIHNIGIHKCAVCGFVQIDQQPSTKEITDLYSADYFSHEKYEDEFCLNRENQRRWKFLEQNGIQKGMKVLEVGCGTGDFLSFVADDLDVRGTDISQDAIKVAARRDARLKNRLLVAGIDDLDEGLGVYDAIVMWDVIEHLWDPVSSLGKLSRSLKPGGRLFFSTPHAGSLSARILGRHWALMTVPEHMGFFERGSVWCLVEKQLGMEILDRRVCGKWVNVSFLFYKLRRKFPSLVGEGLVSFFRRTALKRLAVYVPLGDIQYVAAAKKRTEEAS